MHISVEFYLGFSLLNMQNFCTQGLKAHFKHLKGKNVDVFTHVFFIFLCVVDLAQGLGMTAMW